MIDDALSAFGAGFGQLQQAVFEAAVQPALFRLGLGNLLEDGFEATGWLLAGVVQIAVLLLVVGPLERWRPVEPVTDRAAVRVDVLYTLIHRLGLFRLGLFVLVQPLWDLLSGHARVLGLPTLQLDAIVAPWWRGVTDTAWFSFALYLVVFDFVDYAVHRAQHGWRWWWTLHALHHSQRQMTMWSDNRNHLLDDALRASVFVIVARVIGVEPGQFVALVVATQLIESLAHANLRLPFGPILERIVVGPRYHRLHHGAGPNPAAADAVEPPGRNFAVLLPVWDIVFGTARFGGPPEPTGVRDQWPAHGGRDYGRGFWSQQWLGLVRLAHEGGRRAPDRSPNTMRQPS